ncbi:MAG: type II toxin-antitoxin system VapC family toxin [Caulobacter sp.]|nr:type II toxin-antitoxin system VapC family toxin [Caulobacter sp.]
MKITPDTNVLVRILTRDDEQQRGLAEAEVAGAEIVALTLPTLCELVWVLSRLYRIALPDIATAMRGLAASDNVHLDGPAVDVGLAALEAGGDFADAVIAYEGRRLGGNVFVSFDRKAVRLVAASGEAARLLA